MEQRYRAVLEVEAGCPVTEVAARYGVSRQSVHAWLGRYRSGGLMALADRSHRPASCPHRTAAKVEALVCALRRAHPRWGPARLAHELARQGVDPVPATATLSRILARNGLVIPGGRRRPRSSYQRWERDAAMQLWQIDIMGGVMLTDGREAKLVSGIDDHSRFIVIAHLVLRASARAVCAAFAAALAEHGVPEEVLTDNGKQYTDRFTRPRPVEVLFERICRDNGISARHTKIRSPTTTGKVERWHRTVREEFLDVHAPFPSLHDAQHALDAWVTDYNTARPHQALDMATPADRFTSRPGTGQSLSAALPLRLPADLASVPAAGPPPAPSVPTAAVPVTVPAAVEFDHTVPSSGNMTAAGRQIWLGPALAGRQVTVWASTTTLHVFHHDQLIKTHPVTLTSDDLRRLHVRGARRRPTVPGHRAAHRPTAHRCAGRGRPHRQHRRTGLAGRKKISVRLPLAGRRVTLRIGPHLIHVLDNGALACTRPSPLTGDQRTHPRGARAGDPTALAETGPALVQRVVSSQGSLMVAGCKLHLGQTHCGKVVTVICEDTQFRILHAVQEVTSTGVV
ncbi:IS481 family transposase [Actinomadura sp. 6K520]|uniref:IS481 family transposase n=1 Tax=Actinomadura sp. 6K520 TaxID=2530364 RepID=UPI001FB61800|nr:IS481 family transposase [Actinomadura sp. 6K520]